MMRHLLTAILAVIIFTAGFMTFADNGKKSDTDSSANSQTDTSVTGFSGDTLYQYDGKTVMHDFYANEDKHPSWASEAIITYRDTVPVDTCRVIGSGTFFTDGPVLKYAVGVDTVRLDMRHLPDSINIIMKLCPPGTVRHTYYRNFALTDSSWNCEYGFYAYLPKDHPKWLNQFMALVMRNDIQGQFMDNKGPGRIINEYLGVKPSPRKVDGIDAMSLTPEEIAHHFALEEERLYRKEYPVEEMDGFGPKYDYMLEVSPAWSSPDGRYATYRFYSYCYMGGAHGMMEEYYLTFDNTTGNLLGYQNIIGHKEFPKAIGILEQKLTAKEEAFRGGKLDEPYPAGMNADMLESNSAEILKEVYDGVYYPRPAMTREGIVFSYQPYEKGAFCEGILHFVIPYSRLKTRIPHS